MPSLRLTAATLVLCAAGCGWVPKLKLSSLESDNRRLSEESRAQVAEIENLKAHARRLEDQFIQSEEELAQVDQQSGTDRQKLANLRRERTQLRRQLIGEPGGRPLPLGVSNQLARLARDYPNLKYDDQTGIAKLQTDIVFDTGETDLKPAAVRMLGKLARILQSDDAADLKVMVVGHTDDKQIQGRETRHDHPSNWHLSTARALSVVEALQGAGLEGSRMGVAGYGKHQPITPNDNTRTRGRNRRVEIFVMSPDVPVVGMTETMTEFY